MTSPTILVPFDGSTLAERAVQCAAGLARQMNGTLVLVRAQPDLDLRSYLEVDAAASAERERRLARQAAENELAATANKLRAEGVSVREYVHTGNALEIIVDAARDASASLIVMATHGRSGVGRWLYGSVAEDVLRHAAVPILLVAPHHRAEWPQGRPIRVLVPLDGSALGAGALEAIQELGLTSGAELHLLRIVEPHLAAELGTLGELNVDPAPEARDYLAQIAAPLRARGISVSEEVVSGHPVAVIAEKAQEHDVDLVAMATHGRSGLARFVMGSVALGVLQQSHVPLLAVRSQALRPEPALIEAELTVDPDQPPVAVPMDPGEVALLERSLGELLYASGRDMRLVAPIRHLQAKLRRARTRTDQHVVSSS